MITDKEVARINELYHKSKSEGLTDAEKEEQDKLRKKFVASVRGNLRSQLNNIDVINHEGKIENLGEKYGDKKSNS